MSLTQPTLKMSKSHPNPSSRIHLSDPPELIARKIRGALTDDVGGPITYEPDLRPGVSNLLDIMASLAQQQQQDVNDNNGSGAGSDPQQSAATAATTAVAAQTLAKKHFQTSNLKDFKNEVTKTIVHALEPFRAEYERLMKLDEDGKGDLDEIARVGAEKARIKARGTRDRVREAVGIGGCVAVGGR